MALCPSSFCSLNGSSVCPFVSIVGGLKSSWKGEYREPRCLQLTQGSSLSEPPFLLSWPLPEPPASPRPLIRSPSPSFPCQGPTGRTQPSMAGEECQWLCHSLQSSPFSPKNGSRADLRHATFDYELQQLEFGKDETAHWVSRLQKCLDLATLVLGPVVLQDLSKRSCTL